MALLATALCFAVAGCEKDPHDPQTWIAKLDDPAELEDALRNLERLKDPVAIKPLGNLWRKRNKPTKVLQIIITIAGHEKDGKAHYDQAFDYLKEAVETFDPSDEQSITSAALAAESLGKAGNPDAVPVLIGAVQKPMPKLSPANRVRIASIRALGKYKDPRAVDVLIRVLRADPEQQRLHLHAAAALSLAETGDPKAIPALTQSLVEVGAIYSQVRQGITRAGKPAIPALLALYEDKDPEIQRIAKEKKFAEKAPGVVAFKSALLLGDMRAKEAVPLLLKGLKTEPKVSYFDEKSGAPGPPTHMAFLNALQAIGDPTAAPALLEYATNAKTDDSIRPRAIDVYSWVAPDTAGLAQLLKLVKDEKQEEQIRSVAAIAYGRIGRTDADLKPIEDMIKSYEAKVTAAEAKIKANGKDKAQAENDKATATQWKELLTEAKNRMTIAIECKEDPTCYAKALQAKDVQPGKPGMARAERALIELYRMGEKGRPALDILLKEVETTERLLRDGIHLALPRIAPLPCDDCAKKLQAVVDGQSSQSTLDALNADTRILAHYFMWAGK